MRLVLYWFLLIGILIVGLGTWGAPRHASQRLSAGYGPPPVVWADTTLPSAYNLYFAASGVCRKCHGRDTAGVAMVDAFGQDVNVVDDWRSTMMANAAKDPFWRAQLSMETATFPQQAMQIEHQCTSCHAPLGHYNAHYSGTAPYSLDQLLGDAVGLDGVSCMACHSQAPDSLSVPHSGFLRLDTLRRIYGPYSEPLVSPMLTATSFEPVMGLHIKRAEACGSCHSLLTHTLDDSGTPTGHVFVEQATWHEWLNSSYPAQQVRCQDCHMTSLGKMPIDIAANSNTPFRQPFYRHDLVGANVFMLRLMKDHIEALGLTAGPQHFQKTIDATLHMLQQRSIQLEVHPLWRTLDSAFLQVNLTNLAGHKLPSGYPSRRMWISCVASTPGGDTLFASGMWDSTFALKHVDWPFEPHYDTLTATGQVQIYELVMADAAGMPTTVLKSAAYALKDNRIPPLGFSMEHYTADTTAIVGNALWDRNFNRDDVGVEGTGADQVYYRLATQGYTGPIILTVSVWYQAVPPEWVAPLFDMYTQEAQLFASMYENAHRMPIALRDTTLYLPAWTATTQPQSQPLAKCYLVGEYLSVEVRQPWHMRIYTLGGQCLQQASGPAGHTQMALGAFRGVLVIVLRVGSQHLTFKVVRL